MSPKKIMVNFLGDIRTRRPEKMTIKEGWKIFDSSPSIKMEADGEIWQYRCAKCGGDMSGDFADFFTLIQDYVITGIAKHICGQWHRYVC